MKRIPFLFAAAIMILLPRSSFAGPPFVTDDPQPVEYRHWEIYLASQHLHNDEGWAGTAPHIEVNYGVVPNVQLHLIAPYAYSKPSDSSGNMGYGDTETGIKWRFLEESETRPQVGIFPLIELHSGNASKDLGTGHTQVFLPVWLQKSRGTWTSYGGAGYWINPGEGNKNWILAGWELQKDLSKYLTLGGEVLRRTTDSEDAASSDGFNFGGQINFDEIRHFLFSAGGDIDGPNRFTGYVAFQWTFPADVSSRDDKMSHLPFQLMRGGSYGSGS
jgi:hypothetical protein